MQLFHFVIPMGVAFVATLGAWITASGMEWYTTLTLPTWQPPSALFGPVWTTLYVLVAMAMIFAYDRANARQATLLTVALVANGLLNVGWSLVFFGAHDLFAAIFESGLLALSIGVLIALVWPISRTAAWMLVPYFTWVTFATTLTYAIWSLN